MEEDTNMTDEDKLIQKHRNEKKQLQAEIQQMKHGVPKGDKKRKKEMMERVSQMEAELEQRHQQELDRLNSFNGQVEELSEHVNDLSTDDAKGAMGATCSPEAAATNQTNSGKMSKAQRRRNKKATQERERQAAIDDQEITNLTGPRYLEAQKIKAALAQDNLVVSEIPSDGNCLYAAVEDQLRQQGIQKSVDTLRRLTAEHMRTHMDDFLPFLCNTETGDLYTPDEYQEYCHELETTPAWGGQLEIQALSQVLNCPITVIQADAPPIILGEDGVNQKITLTYHHHVYKLGAHYNSVKPKPPDEEDELS